MALVSVSKFTDGSGPEIARMSSGWISIMYGPGAVVHISLSDAEAVDLVERLADFLGMRVPSALEAAE